MYKLNHSKLHSGGIWECFQFPTDSVILSKHRRSFVIRKYISGKILGYLSDYVNCRNSSLDIVDIANELATDGGRENIFLSFMDLFPVCLFSAMGIFETKTFVFRKLCIS